MRAEDLFLAIGTVEESRLLRGEISIETTVPTKVPAKRILRNILVAALIAGVLLLTACAVMGYVLFDSPAQMLDTIFGDQTGYDHQEPYTYTDPENPENTWEVPGFDRVPVDESVAQEDIAPHVSAVGQSISWRGYTLTIDALMYDSVTQCGILTYLVENPEGITCNIEPNGKIWNGPINFNKNGETYVIQEKTTETCLAAAQYFLYDPEDERDMELTISQWNFVEPGAEYQQHIMELFEQIQQEYTEEEAIEAYIREHGQEEYDAVRAESTEEEMRNFCYGVLWTARLRELYECPYKITIYPDEESTLKSITLADGAVTISPISMLMDVTNLEFLHTDVNGNNSVDAGNARKLTIRYTDGTEYLVFSETVNNTVVALHGQIDGSGPYALGTYMFNRIIDIDKVESVIVNGTELPVN